MKNIVYKREIKTMIRFNDKIILSTAHLALIRLFVTLKRSFKRTKESRFEKKGFLNLRLKYVI